MGNPFSRQQRQGCARIASGQDGFTLVEIMAAVAITGTILAIAIPNYMTMTAKSRQSEAKIKLAAMYTAEKQFSLEWKSFTACLNQTGYKPDTSPQYYAAGFTNLAATQNICGKSGNLPCNQPAAPNVTCTAGTLLATDGPTAHGTVFQANTLANQGLGFPVESNFTSIPGHVGVGIYGFSIGAVGNISSSSSSFDVWTIDQTKSLTNRNSGI